MKALIRLLMTLGKVTVAKTGKGFFVYNPKAFDLPMLTKLAEAQSFQVVHTQAPSHSINGTWLPPKLFVGPGKTLSEAELIAQAEAW